MGLGSDLTSGRPADFLQRFTEACFSNRMEDHHQLGVGSSSLLDDAFDADAMIAEDLGDRRQHSGFVLDFQTQIEFGDDLVVGIEVEFAPGVDILHDVRASHGR